MKNKLITLALALVLTPMSPAIAGEPVATINRENLAKLSTEDQTAVLCIAERFEEIAAMDRSSLTPEDKRALKAEVKALKDQAADYNRGGTVLYISTAGIIIILLIILILA